MRQPVIRYLDVASIYAVIVLFGISAVDFITIDQTKRISGLTMLILIAGIIITRLLARQQRQINALRGHLPSQQQGASQPTHAVPQPPMPASISPAAVASTALPANPPLPSNVVDFRRR